MAAAVDSQMTTPPGVWWLWCALALTGCVKSRFISKTTPAQAENACSIIRSEVRKVTSVYSPQVYIGRREAWDWRRYSMAAEKSDVSKEPTYFLLFHSQRLPERGYAHWEKITDERGNVFPTARGLSEGSKWKGREEAVSAVVSRNYLETLAATNTNMRIHGEREELVFEIHAAIIAGFLQKCDTTYFRID